MKQLNSTEKMKLIEANEFAMFVLGIICGLALAALSLSFIYNYTK